MERGRILVIAHDKKLITHDMERAAVSADHGDSCSSRLWRGSLYPDWSSTFRYFQIIYVSRVKPTPLNGLSRGSLAVVLLVGAGGIILGVIAFLDINSAVLTPIATIAFGAGLVLRSTSAWGLYLLQQTSAKLDDQSQFGDNEALGTERDRELNSEILRGGEEQASH